MAQPSVTEFEQSMGPVGPRFLEPISRTSLLAKNFFDQFQKGERMEHFEGLFDKLRHRQSDKFRRCDRPRDGTRQPPRRMHFKLHEMSDVLRISFEGRIV
jgi:hypothetical protein